MDGWIYLEVRDVIEAQIVIGENGRFGGVSHLSHQDFMPSSGALDQRLLVEAVVLDESPVQRSHRLQLDEVHVVVSVGGARRRGGRRGRRSGHFTRMCLVWPALS